MAKRKTQNKSKFFLLVGMLILAVGLFVSSKLVQQNQENRSQAKDPKTISKRVWYFSSTEKVCKYSQQSYAGATDWKAKGNTSPCCWDNKSACETANKKTATSKRVWYFSSTEKVCKYSQQSYAGATDWKAKGNTSPCCWDNKSACETANKKSLSANKADNNPIPKTGSSKNTYNEIYNETDEQIINKLNKVFKGGLSGTGKFFVNYSKGENHKDGYDRDPYAIAAIAIHESWGGYSCNTKNKNNPGEVLGRKYNSIEEGIKDIFWVTSINTKINSLTLKGNKPPYQRSNFERMQQVYNTHKLGSSIANNWIKKVTQYYGNLRSGINTGIVPPKNGGCF